MSPEPKQYASAAAFRQALENRLLSELPKSGVPLERLRKRVAFDRFLARLFDGEPASSPRWLLKGGYSMEIRYSNIARMTKDVDLSLPVFKNPTPEKIRELLAHSAEKDLADWFVFLVGPYSQELQQAVYGGWRYAVTAMLAGRNFTSFHVDVGVGDAVISAPDWETGSGLLSFAGIAPARAALLPIEQHFAEKIHSFTIPRPAAPNSRVKDFVDLALLIENGLPDAKVVSRAVEATFARRQTHPVPEVLPDPPVAWEKAYAAMAADCGVKHKEIQDAAKYISEYWGTLP